MSLINQVLKDIDQRTGGTGPASPLDGNVKPVGDNAPASTTKRLPVLLGLLAVLAAVGAWIILGRGDGRPESVPAVIAVPTAVPSAPTSPAPPAPVVASAAAEAPSSSSASLNAIAEAAQDWAKTELGPESMAGAEASPAPASPDPMQRVTPDSAGSVSKVVTASQVSDALYRRAEQAFRGDRVTEGQRLLRQALERNAKNHPARELLARVLIDLGRTGEAARVLEEGLAVAPDRKAFVLPLALLKQQAGDETGSLELLEASIGGLEGDAEAHAFLAALLQRQGRHAESTNNYVIALRRFPANGQWLVGLGVSLQEQGLRQAAIDAYQGALATASLDPALEAFATRQLALAQQGN